MLLAGPVVGQEEALGLAGVDPEALRAAERQLAGSRDALEEIAGRELLEAEAPPLPSAEGMEALGEWREHRELLDRLSDVEPADWSERDRQLVDELLPFDLTCRAVLAGGEDGDGETAEEGGQTLDRDAEDPMPDLLAILNGVRVVALGDRLALLRGDEADVLAGIALRFDLAERLSLQDSSVGPLIGSAIREITLRDVQRLVERVGTAGETLAGLDDLLFRAHLEVPESAAITARVGLRLSDPDRRLPGVAVPDEAAMAFFLAPVAAQFVIMARTCRERGCAAVARALADERARAAEEEDAAASRIFADLLMPNLVDMTRKLEIGAERIELARAAVALRREALEQGAYPATADRVLDGLGLEGGTLEGLRYELHPDGGASLGLDLGEDIEAEPKPRQETVRRLSSWELPPPPEKP